MNILYIGDIMGEEGIKVVEQVLPELKRDRQLDLVIAQAENVTEGKGISPEDFNRLQSIGIDFCTGGNWSINRETIIPQLDDPDEPIIRPANYPSGTPGLGYKYIETTKGIVLVISLLGQIVGRDADKPVDNPLIIIDKILQAEQNAQRIATVVNFHGDFSSEKRVIGYYLDGRVTMAVGDHWHVPTADAMILPKGTAHQSDVGMCGHLHSSLGVELDSIIPRWLTGHPTVNRLATGGPRQFNALYVETNDTTGLANFVESINLIKQV